jgi:feruloyl esterase
VNAIVNNPTSTGFIAPPAWGSIHQEILAQCDALDGVTDGIITYPGRCFLDFEKFGCGGGSKVLNATTCLKTAQLKTLQTVYTNWTDPATGDFIFPAFNHGGEFLFAASVNGV